MIGPKQTTTEAKKVFFAFGRDMDQERLSSWWPERGALTSLLVLGLLLVPAGAAFAEEASGSGETTVAAEAVSEIEAPEPGESAANAEAEAGTASTEPTAEALEAEEVVTLWYFWRHNCPHCRRADEWLEELTEKHPNLVLNRVEVIDDAEGRALFMEMMRQRGEQASGVPAFILDDYIWIGFTSPLAEDMEAEIAARIAQRVREASSARSTIDLGPFGMVDLSNQPMVGATVLIAFVDGFNPCSIWVLTVLLAMILGTRSRARIAAVGLTFLLVTASIYGVFIAGLFAAFMVAGHLGWIQVVVAFLALGFGLVNVKDFFAFKQGFSFSIPERFKPKIYKGGRTLRQDRPLLSTLAITVGLAAGVALIELPCTAGFPVVWTTLVSEAGIGGAAFAGLLGIYLLVYLGVEIFILVVAVVTLRASRLQEEHGRTLKLFGGMIMIALAIVILIDPSIMEQLLGSLVVILIAVGVSAIVMIGERILRAKRGKQPEKKVKEPKKEKDEKPAEATEEPDEEKTGEVA